LNLAFFDFLKRKEKGVRRNEPRVRDPRHDTRPIQPAQLRHDPANRRAETPNPGPYDRHEARETVVVPSTPPPQHEAKTPYPEPPAPPPQRPAAGPAARVDAATVVIDAKSLLTGGVLGVLVAIDGDFEGEVYKVREGENKIGRGDDCQIQIPGASVSRSHALLTYTKGMFAIQPVAEGSPTFVNDDRITGALQLSDGATIKIGQTTLKFRTVA
jgi:hypothetical protein